MGRLRAFPDGLSEVPTRRNEYLRESRWLKANLSRQIRPKGLTCLISMAALLPVASSALAAQSRTNVSRTSVAAKRTQRTDTRAQLFDLETYGAKGDGTTDDTPAFNSALKASLVSGGKIYFPAGTFVLSDPDAIALQETTKSISIECAGPTSTTLLLKGNGFLLRSNWNAPYLYGYIRDCKFDLTQAPAESVAIHLIDSDGWSLEDDSFVSSPSTQATAIELENHKGWCERNYIVRDSFFELKASILFEQDRGDKYNSFAYNVLAFDHFQVPAGGDGVLVDGPSVLYSNYWVLRANMDGSGNLVHALAGASLRYNYYDIRGEGGGGSAYMLCADARSNISGNGAIYAFGSGNNQGFTCPGAGNINVYAQGTAASNASWPNWIGTGKAVSVYGDSVSADGAEGAGNVIGANISSPFVWMYFQPGNAFVIGDEKYPPSASNFFPVSWFDSAGNGILTGHIQVGGSHGSTWSSGSGSPSGRCANGSLYSNTSGARGSTLYICVSGSWVDVK